MQLILAFLTAAGVGGIVGAIVQSHLQHLTHVREQQHALREKRYLCILILMLSRLNRRAGLLKLRELRPDLGSNYDIDNELEAEYLNAFVFAGDAVLSSFGHFVADPTHDN